MMHIGIGDVWISHIGVTSFVSTGKIRRVDLWCSHLADLLYQYQI